MQKERRKALKAGGWLYLPTDQRTLKVIVCLVVGAIIAIKTGDLSLLLFILRGIFGMPSADSNPPTKAAKGVVIL